MRSLRLLVPLALALAWLVSVPTASYACSCAQADAADHVERADVVVRGVIADMSEPSAGKVRSSGDPVTYRVSVTETYKGATGGSLDVLSVASGASCGLEGIRLGEEYVVFASRDAHLGWGGTGGRDLWANLCGGTAPATPGLVAAVTAATTAAPAAPVVPTAAPAGRAGDAASNAAADSSSPGRGPVAVGAGAVLLALAVAGWLRSRRPTG